MSLLMVPPQRTDKEEEWHMDAFDNCGVKTRTAARTTSGDASIDPMSLVFAVVAYRLLLSGSRVFAACSPPADERLGARRQRAVASRGPPPKQKTGLPAQACSDGSACPRPVTDHGLGDDRPQFDARPATKQITAPAAEPPANRQIRSLGTAGKLASSCRQRRLGTVTVKISAGSTR